MAFRPWTPRLLRGLSARSLAGLGERKLSSLSETAGEYVETSFGRRTLRLETGRIAHLADGAVFASVDGTQILATAVGEPRSEAYAQGFVDLVCDYTEKNHAYGRMPVVNRQRERTSGGYEETLISRSIDRSLRPLFPKNFVGKCQVTTTLMSNMMTISCDVLAINAASAALYISSIPWGELGPLAAVRVVAREGELLVNPEPEMRTTISEFDVEGTQDGGLDLLYAGTKDKGVMIEMAGVRVTNERLEEAIHLAQSKLGGIIDGIRDLGEKAKNSPRKCEKSKTYIAANGVEAYEDEAMQKFGDGFRRIFLNPPEGRNAREEALWSERKSARSGVASLLAERNEIGNAADLSNLSSEVVASVESRIFRENVFKVHRDTKEQGSHRKRARIDGRGIDEIRPLSAEAGILERPHGSALFSRGDTQVLTTASIGHPDLATRVIGPSHAQTYKRLHAMYEFPPYCTNEVRNNMQGRRELGHGALTEKALRHAVPMDSEETYYIHTTTTASNGSSSMGSVSAASLALYDAGIDLYGGLVAGISMGLVSQLSEGGQFEYVILTDIMGLEDFLGDMDFKIAGTVDAITAMQLDMKLPGVPPEILIQAIRRSQPARAQIIQTLQKALPHPRPRPESTPKIEYMELKTWERKEISVHGFSNLSEFTAKSGCHLKLYKGSIVLFGSKEERDRAKKMIRMFFGDLEVGKEYQIVVTKILEYGVLVDLTKGSEMPQESLESESEELTSLAKEGFIHSSNLSTAYLKHSSDFCRVGDEFCAVCIGRQPLSGRQEFALKGVHVQSVLAQ